MKSRTNFLDSRMPRVAVLVVICASLLPCVLLAKSFKLQAASIVPGATGEVKTGKDKNGNTKFTVEVKHLAEPNSLTPPRSTYIVWIQRTGASPESQGVLKVSRNLDGKFESSTQDKAFDLWITAESDPTTKSPSGPEVLRANGVAP
jgi:hypothetical protein